MILRAPGVEAVVEPEAGGRVASLRVDGTELLVTERTGVFEWGLFPMVPWAGRVRRGRFAFDGVEHQLPLAMPPHAIHGTTPDRRWEVADATEDACELVVDLGPDWPFAGRARHGIRLGDGRLDLTLEVEATADPFPASVGWHPWFRRHLDRGGPVALQLDAGAMWARDAEGIPSGHLLRPPPPPPWDDCFTELAQPPTLRWPGALTLTVRSPCPDVVVYDEPAHALCVEPQTGPPDALNLRPEVVAPGRPLRAGAALTWALA